MNDGLIAGVVAVVIALYYMVSYIATQRHDKRTGWDRNPCRGCGGECCKRIRIRIVTPTNFTSIGECKDKARWVLSHPNVWFSVNKDEWFVDVNTTCQYLDENGKCSIYEKRPAMCRDYSAENCIKNNPCSTTISLADPESFDYFVENMRDVEKTGGDADERMEKQDTSG